MYKSEFDKYLKSGKKFSSYMFYGQSTFMVEFYSSIIAKIVAKNEDIEKIYYDEYNFKYIQNRLLQSSLFSSSNIVLLKIAKKIPKKELDALVLAASTNQDSTLIVACFGDDADFKSMESSFNTKTNSAFVRFFPLKDSEAITYLENEAKIIGLDFEKSALNHLFFMHKGDLNLCVNDLSKLKILNDKITSKDVDIHCFGLGLVNFDNFLHELLSFKDVTSDLDLLLEEGMDSVFIVNQITQFVHQLFLISSYARSFGAPNAIEILGFNPPKDIWEKKARLAINTNPKKFLKIYDFLLNLELDLKNSKRISNPSLFLQSSIRKFTALFR
ncbi:DNA polymerase III subunit delta [Aliarcobacter skirrowii]|uniref:DNA polymerase III subunit delta n=1 Tax=Aliarcobacter skirrowii TaxID=28200 RepID=UPI002A37228A|nr:DNA polymerase III subunit delta [Aliarcobacter skirrowii]MDY0180920.1 DNA polymerase III subunit delta [Aliarcobacter skirrowii]